MAQGACSTSSRVACVVRERLTGWLCGEEDESRVEACLVEAPEREPDLLPLAFAGLRGGASAGLSKCGESGETEAMLA